MIDINTLWQIYNKIEKYAKTFYYNRFNYNQIKLENCNIHITDKVTINNIHKNIHDYGNANIELTNNLITPKQVPILVENFRKMENESQVLFEKLDELVEEV